MLNQLPLTTLKTVHKQNRLKLAKDYFNPICSDVLDTLFSPMREIYIAPSIYCKSIEIY